MVHLGVFQRLEWVRLPTKHSHNYCDRTFSMIKEVIFPRRGAGGGCNAPWDMKLVLDAALKSQRGDIELVWQWQNFNWTSLFKDLKAIHKDFGSFNQYRHWLYEVIDPLGRATYCTPKTCEFDAWAVLKWRV